MANAKKCDRCGNFFVIAPSVTYGNIKTGTKKMLKNGVIDITHADEFDICSKCNDAFKKFMSNESTEEKENA